MLTHRAGSECALHGLSACAPPGHASPLGPAPVITSSTLKWRSFKSRRQHIHVLVFVLGQWDCKWLFKIMSSAFPVMLFLKTQSTNKVKKVRLYDLHGPIAGECFMILNRITCGNKLEV